MSQTEKLTENNVPDQFPKKRLLSKSPSNRKFRRRKILHVNALRRQHLHNQFLQHNRSGFQNEIHLSSK